MRTQRFVIPLLVGLLWSLLETSAWAGFLYGGAASDLSCTACVSLTTEVSGILPLANGGSNANLTPAAGGLVYSTASALAIQAAGTSGYFAQSGGTGAPTWFNLLGTANTWSALQTFSGGITGGNTLSILNGTNAQTVKIYETYTDASNYSRLSISAPSGGPITLASEAAGTGVARDFAFGAGVATNNTVVKINGGTNSSRGSSLIFQRGGVDKIYIGTDSWINGSTSSGLTFYSVDNFPVVTQVGNTVLQSLSTNGLSIGPVTSTARLGLTLTNGQQLNTHYVTELTTIAAAATTDTAIQIPLNTIVKSCSVRVTTVIPTAATFTVTGTTSGTQFDVAGGVSTAAGTTDKGINNTPYRNGAAQTIRITPNLTPADNSGRVRVTCWYEDVTPATS